MPAKTWPWRTSKLPNKGSAVSAALAGEASLWMPVQAIPWNVVPGAETSDANQITGHFSLDSEWAATPVMLATNVAGDGLVVAAAAATKSNRVSPEMRDIDATTQCKSQKTSPMNNRR